MSNIYVVPCFVMISYQFSLDIVANSPEEAIEKAKAMLASSDPEDKNLVELAYSAGEYLAAGDEPIEVADDPYLVIIDDDQPEQTK